MKTYIKVHNWEQYFFFVYQLPWDCLVNKPCITNTQLRLILKSTQMIVGRFSYIYHL